MALEGEGPSTLYTGGAGAVGRLVGLGGCSGQEALPGLITGMGLLPANIPPSRFLDPGDRKAVFTTSGFNIRIYSTCAFI